MKEFRSYTEAARFGRGQVKDLAKGRAVGLTPEQARGAAAAFDLLQGFYAETGKRVPLLDCVAGYCGALRKLKDRPLGEALDTYLNTVATVKPKGVSEAVEEWLAGRKSKTLAKEGKRPQLSGGYHYNTCLALREFAKFVKTPQEFTKTPEELAALAKGWKEIPVRAIRDLCKEHLDAYFSLHAALAPKSRNERRMTLRMFLKWCVAKDYLHATHRLFEADGMEREDSEPGEVACYTAAELRAMLDRASRQPAPVKEGQEPEADCRDLLPVVVLIALGGIRLQEATRLTWQDVWHVEGHIEVSVSKSKTRSRRLSTMCPALAAWLEGYQERTGPLWKYGLQHFHKTFERMLAGLEIPVRRNALRHGFVSAHYALYADEGLTAKEAGNSPGVVHANYKGLMTKAQGEAWFNVMPARPGNVVMLSGTARQK
jgi:integrase